MPSSADYPPGPRAPRLHQTLRYNADFIGFMESCLRRYGDAFTVRPYPYATLVAVTAPEDVQAVLFDKQRFIRGSSADLIKPIAGERSVIFLSGDDHMRQRKLLLPPFHGEQVKRWSERIEAIAEEELDRLPLGVPISLRPTMQRITFDVICRLVFGMKDAARVAKFNAAMLRMLDPRFAPLLFFPFMFRRGGGLHPSRLFFARRDPVDRLIHEEIVRHRADPAVAERDDVLAMLIVARDESSEPLSDAELRDEMLGLLNAGHETTATALAWAGERLARNPAVQDRLVEELEVGADEYLEAFVEELLRIRPPVADTPRCAVEDTELGGHPIPAGTVVSAVFSITQRRADLWEEPLAFKPERFLEGKPTPYSHMPFGGGIRRCIGAPLANSELRIVLRAMLRRFRFESADGPEAAIRRVGATLAPSDGGRVVLRAAAGFPNRRASLDRAIA